MHIRGFSVSWLMIASTVSRPISPCEHNAHTHAHTMSTAFMQITPLVLLVPLKPFAVWFGRLIFWAHLCWARFCLVGILKKATADASVYSTLCGQDSRYIHRPPISDSSESEVVSHRR
uniref:Putative secreted peptide n=1 Tax=Anopheles braziliensis TaxID=58242 RepID=A0A2M3ZUS4_9DIPT